MAAAVHQLEFVDSYASDLETYLTDSELEVATMLAQGATLDDIAIQTELDQHDIERLKRKQGIKNAVKLITREKLEDALVVLAANAEASARTLVELTGHDNAKIALDAVKAHLKGLGVLKEIRRDELVDVSTEQKLDDESLNDKIAEYESHVTRLVTNVTG